MAGKEVSEVVLQVDSVDNEANRVLSRDSEMELEMLELFKDITLEDVVSKKSCGWRMKKCPDGVMGFFFDSEHDCSFVMEKRLWLVNGVLLNLKPWPTEGEIRIGEFEVARFWVQFHGLPTRCLSDDNAPIVAKKVGHFVQTDGKTKFEWQGRFVDPVQIRKVATPLFQLWPVSHFDKVCQAPLAMVVPNSGKAVKMYGPWIKSEFGGGNCFSMAGRGETLIIEESRGWSKNSGSGGRWKRKSQKNDGKRPMLGDNPARNILLGEGTSTVQKNVEVVAQNDTRHGIGNVSGRSSCTILAANSTSDEVAKAGILPEHSNEQRPIPIGPNFLNLPRPDFANGSIEEGKIPDIGSSMTQSLEIPHSRLCNHKSHISFQSPLTSLGQLMTQKDKLSSSNSMALRKRKAHSWYQPSPSPPKCNISEISESEECLVLNKSLEVDPQAKFVAGSSNTKVEDSKKGRGSRKSKLVGGVNVSEVFEAGFRVTVRPMCGYPQWNLFCVYGTPYGELKKLYWDWLTSKVHICISPWALLGDLNVIGHASEKEGGNVFHYKEGDFLLSFLAATGGVDLGFEGPMCTWQNARKASQRIRKRLDRAIANGSWCIEFPHAKVSHHPILGSYHSPLVLSLSEPKARLNYPFRFLEVWTSSHECGEVISESWSKPCIGSHALWTLGKLKSVGVTLFAGRG
ncbi:hypothetical protein G4B88_008188 [Cannabis sativa]|uniref:DUF4283 domain-containing protein n=1 Tax=Cannabis sativa TaxID=3483 RepID=A0A7J6ETB5_CANSA|nr:hypothetical protein G4B88_008188 [Cannabis sativa]